MVPSGLWGEQKPDGSTGLVINFTKDKKGNLAVGKVYDYSRPDKLKSESIVAKDDNGGTISNVHNKYTRPGTAKELTFDMDWPALSGDTYAKEETAEVWKKSRFIRGTGNREQMLEEPNMGRNNGQRVIWTRLGDAHVVPTGCVFLPSSLTPTQIFRKSFASGKKRQTGAHSMWFGRCGELALQDGKICVGVRLLGRKTQPVVPGSSSLLEEDLSRSRAGAGGAPPSDVPLPIGLWTEEDTATTGGMVLEIAEQSIGHLTLTAIYDWRPIRQNQNTTTNIALLPADITDVQRPTNYEVDFSLDWPTIKNISSHFGHMALAWSGVSKFVRSFSDVGSMLETPCKGRGREMTKIVWNEMGDVDVDRLRRALANGKAAFDSERSAFVEAKGPTPLVLGERGHKMGLTNIQNLLERFHQVRSLKKHFSGKTAQVVVRQKRFYLKKKAFLDVSPHFVSFLY